MIQHFYSGLVKKGIAPKSVWNLHGTLHKALNQAEKLGIICVNPADACDLPKVIKHEMTPIPDDELGNFLNAIKDSLYYAYYCKALQNSIGVVKRNKKMPKSLRNKDLGIQTAGGELGI